MNHSRLRRGVTLVEMIVAIGIVSVLFSLALTAMSAASVAARASVCMANMRSASSVLQVYGLDYRDALPFGGTGVSHTVLPDGNQFAIGGVWGLSNGLWSALLPDLWQGPHWSRGLRCPKQPDWDPAAPLPNGPLLEGQLQTPAFWMSSAMWLDAASLARFAPWDQVRPRQNYSADVAYPSKKVLLFEAIAFCASEPDAQTWISLGQTPYCRSSFALCDGSVLRARIADALPPPLGAWTFATIDGVRGRDFR
jgi:prepilin-type N-terminal cleavage/methylation domain-containing protein